ncbi:hypothetical protein IRP63_07190 [Clostridium botulinum]|uniref:Uncharacterized protein n=1 Tax=Clostridium botulinum C/D str. DC5 TaxID=1443128 RepID=A0A0A0IP44_CLOBO|nr:hypothetical protein [Clostridium botulinum]KGN01962.1 hypothetical protein Z955_00755 [Clostridium botulinum C/D str. DC5]MCD3232702.1 hypothetical protein [Clostridium botulinum D/C]MCD3238564.1 hypothetical protein [Clostridium botulinum D/C]MCD3266112.1 hypothetical protein [Clostridium botulinum D/C]MCD3300717.1 hypothetical protein [Clostridium botulinum D/C]
MLTNVKCCCIKTMCPICAWGGNNLDPNPQLYLQITNSTNASIYFIIQYSLVKGTVTKKSPTFGYNKTERLIIPPRAQNVCYNVLTTSTIHSMLICHDSLLTPSRVCLRVIQTPDGLTCVPMMC